MDIRRNADFMAMWALTFAIKRGKTRENMTHEEIYNGIKEELDEFLKATDEPSEHLPQFSQRQEELADIILACFAKSVRPRIKDIILPMYWLLRMNIMLRGYKL